MSPSLFSFLAGPPVESHLASLMTSNPTSAQTLSLQCVLLNSTASTMQRYKIFFDCVPLPFLFDHRSRSVQRISILRKSEFNLRLFTKRFNLLKQCRELLKPSLTQCLVISSPIPVFLFIGFFKCSKFYLTSTTSLASYFNSATVYLIHHTGCYRYSRSPLHLYRIEHTNHAMNTTI